ncbi:MAG: hypothetical protein IPJ66_09325 [Bacteroidetes bacterium]|nr:hypothetical protein [Bacteroidota bacterium]
MNERYFISSKKGKIKSISIYKYNFTTDLDKQNDQKVKFCKWLKMNPEILLYEIGESYFITFLPLTESKTWQYKFCKMESITPPFDNITLISNYLGHLIRNVYNQHFEQYLNHNTYVIDNLNLHPFHLLKCFDFNVEVFNDGDFFIHFLPVSKIVNSKDITSEYLINLRLKNENNSKTDNMLFNLVDCKYFKKQKFDLLDSDCSEKITEFVKDRKKVVATFDYHFVANYSPAIFGEITENTIKELSTSIDFLIPVSQLIVMPDFIELSDKPFSEIIINHLTKKTNLLIGNGKKVIEQKAAFYNGIYRPVSDKVVQPIIIDGLKIDMFIDLITKFNAGGNVEILNPIVFSSNEVIDISTFKQLKRIWTKTTLCNFY